MASLSRRSSFAYTAPSSQSSQLLEAAREGRALEVKNLLDGRRDGSVEDLDINARGKAHMTPLLFATEGNHESVLKVLLVEDLLDVNAQDELGRTALIIAAQKSLESVTRMLLQDRDDTNVLIRAQGGATPLHVAAWYGHTVVVNLLVGGGVEPREDDCKGSLPSPASRFKKALKGGNSFFGKDMYFPKESRFRVFRKSQSPDSGSKGDLMSSSSSSVSVAKKSVISSKDSPEQNSSGKDMTVPQQPTIAANGRTLSCQDAMDSSNTQDLLESFGDSMRPPPSCVSLNSQKNFCVSCVSAKSQKNSLRRNSGGQDLGAHVKTLSTSPSLDNSVQKKLLEAKTSAEHLTALHLAAGNGHVQVVLALIRAYGQAVGVSECLGKVREKGGDDALDSVFASILRILHSHDAEEDFRNEKSKMRKYVLDKALDSILGEDATSGSSSGMSWSSIQAMVGFMNEKDCIGRTPLHHAVWERHVGVMERLVDSYVVNVNAGDMDGFTPLHLAARKGAEDVVKLLLSQESKFQIVIAPNLKARQNRATRARMMEIKRAQQKLTAVLPIKHSHDFVFPEERDGMTALHYAMEGRCEGIVAALAAQPDVDVFSVATLLSSQPSMLGGDASLSSSARFAARVMQVGDIPDDDRGELRKQSPVTMALAMKDITLLRLVLKSGKRNKIMQDVQELRNYFAKNTNAKDVLDEAKEYHKIVLETTVQIVKRDREALEEDLYQELELEMTLVLNTLMRKPVSNQLTLLHHAAFAGLSQELEFLLGLPSISADINTGDTNDQAPLHYAAMEGKTETVKVLLRNMQLRPNDEDSYNRTALQIATERKSRDIVLLLMGCEDVRFAVDALYRERVVNDNAVNAILVVAALIASVTFAGWLQPPLGYRNYYNLGAAHGDPPGTLEAYAAVEQVHMVLNFWIFNSLSFFFAMGTVVSGAAELLPMRDAFIGQEVRMVRGGLVRTSLLLILSIIFVLVAFAAAGKASLPPLEKYQKVMSWTIFSGASICIAMLFIFWSRLGHMLMSAPDHQKVKWWRFQESDMRTPRRGGAKVVWSILKFYNLIPENYTKFDSRRQEDHSTCKKKIFWLFVRIFRLEKGENTDWRYPANH